ncbi:WXG100 family type VII secretion target [Angustibacter sp. McL0619]|uniref:WXG100 family type VII secretion target n=1 Tax=Angustibacter sp. McL0619 TaxID=3415676 RepID=UPI003CE8126D
MSNARVVDEATTAAMVSAFDDAYAECSNATSKVESASTALLTSWTGDAARAYGRSLDDWQNGVAKVKSGLERLSEAMAGYRQITAAAEGASQQAAGSWAAG